MTAVAVQSEARVIGPGKFAPGRYDNLPAEIYHAQHALGSSGAWQLESECPALFWWRSAFNPAYVPEQKRAFDIGTAVHLIALQPAQFAERTVIIDAANYLTKAAKEARDAAYDAGLTPLLVAELDNIKAMRDALMAHPIARHAFEDAVPEVTYFWHDSATGIPCKARPDLLPAHRRYLPDLKSSTTANPRAFERKAADLGYHMRMAWYLEGIAAVEGEAPNRAVFIVQAKEPPFLVSVCWLDDEALSWGRLQVRRAMETFARCMERDEWPGYRDRGSPETDSAFTIGLPTWTRTDLQKQHEAGEFSRYEQLIAAGAHPFA